MKNETARRQYDDLCSVANAPAGKALAVLAQVEPDTAERFEQNGWTDDATIRDHARTLAQVVYDVARLGKEPA